MRQSQQSPPASDDAALSLSTKRQKGELLVGNWWRFLRTLRKSHLFIEFKHSSILLWTCCGMWHLCLIESQGLLKIKHKKKRGRHLFKDTWDASKQNCCPCLRFSFCFLSTFSTFVVQPFQTSFLTPALCFFRLQKSTTPHRISVPSEDNAHLKISEFVHHWPASHKPLLMVTRWL